MACRLAEGPRSLPRSPSFLPLVGEWTVVKKSPKPRFISKETALRKQRELDITGLCDTLLSIESRDLQALGWRFNKVVKNDEESRLKGDGVPSDNEDEQYVTLPIIGNKWGDIAVFVRVRSAGV